MPDHDASAILAMTTGIIANFVANNRVSPDELPGLVAAVRKSLSALGDASNTEPDIASAPTKRLTAAAVRKLITPEGVTSLIDGRKFKSLKRHLSKAGYTPQAYREKFGLPSDFPMVHPEHAALRSAVAKATGFGKGAKKPRSALSPAVKLGQAEA
ncbi:hypothetical protein BZG35_03540 [Brevundimonas sp. LM2]|uniref:MucR family transcriptional regulator n=1 Tax=Brevundimonas sp. LM2 TaxID=1938605 RepID=UPI000983DD7D|nr:MucR family transcriptional regulator [Brevundimonas sp. LM2]AQR60829.1 hypothetical protein BZG35_03540 [Brevundimonas sp. LM2]